MEERRTSKLSDEEIEKIAEAVSKKTKEAFHIDEEDHYNSHQRLDKLLDAYDNATNIFMKAFISMVIVGALLLAGFSLVKR